MKWFKVWGSGLQTNPKWLALTLEERGAWITLMTIASGLEPRWRFRSAQHAGLLLTRECTVNAEGLLNRLMDERLLDLMDDGSVEIHDYADWQTYPSDAPEATRERQRRSRAARAGIPDEAPVTSRRHGVTTTYEVPGHQHDQERDREDRDREVEDREGKLISGLLNAGLDPDLARRLDPVDGRDASTAAVNTSALSVR